MLVKLPDTRVINPTRLNEMRHATNDAQWPGVAASILEGLDEILTVVRLKLPKELRRSLACTNIAENMMGTFAASRATSNAGGMPVWPCDGSRPA